MDKFTELEDRIIDLECRLSALSQGATATSSLGSVEPCDVTGEASILAGKMTSRVSGDVMMCVSARLVGVSSGQVELSLWLGGTNFGSRVFEVVEGESRGEFIVPATLTGGEEYDISVGVKVLGGGGVRVEIENISEVGLSGVSLSSGDFGGCKVDFDGENVLAFLVTAGMGYKYFGQNSESLSFGDFEEYSIAKKLDGVILKDGDGESVTVCARLNGGGSLYLSASGNVANEILVSEGVDDFCIGSVGEGRTSGVIAYLSGHTIFVKKITNSGNVALACKINCDESSNQIALACSKSSKDKLMLIVSTENGYNYIYRQIADLELTEPSRAVVCTSILYGRG